MTPGTGETARRIGGFQPCGTIPNCSHGEYGGRVRPAAFLMSRRVYAQPNKVGCGDGAPTGSRQRGSSLSGRLTKTLTGVTRTRSSGDRAQQLLQSLRFRIALEPSGKARWRQRYWHTVMDWRHHRVRLDGDESTRLGDSTAGRIAPTIPDTGESERVPGGKIDVEGLLAAIAEALPLVESIGGNQAASLLERLTICGLGGNGLGAGVDQAVTDGDVLGPPRDEAPPQHMQTALRALRTNDGNRLRRCDVVAWSESRQWLEAEHVLEDVGRGPKREASAHTIQ